MSILNVPASSQNGVGVTGLPPKQFDFKRLRSIWLLPVGFEFSAAECASAATFKTALILHSQKDLRNVRIFPIHGLTDYTLNDKEPTQWTSGFGVSEMLDNGGKGLKLTFRKGGAKRQANLAEFNNEDYIFILEDQNAKFLGVKSSNSLLTGFDGKFTANPPTLAVPGTPALYTCDLSFTDPSQFLDLDKIGFMDCDGAFNSEKDVPGILAIQMEHLTTAIATTAYIKIYTTDGHTDMYDQYETQFAATALFSAVKADGTALTISSITAVDATKSWTVVFAAYTGTATLTMDGPATLAAANIGGAPGPAYECTYSIDVVLPAP